MKIERAQIVDRLVAEEPCLAAVFCSYTFDPAFFEEQVLRALLRLTSDPREPSQRYQDEACSALQATPVACFVDAGVRRPGRRLPYDLTLFRGRTFHPKLTLAIYERRARLIVGSANLTPAGFGGNAELLMVHDLAYDDRGQAGTLQEVAGFLRAIDATSRPVGSQLELALDELERRLREGGHSDATAEAARASAFLHTECETPLLDQLTSLLPSDARVVRAGVMAPFYENDDPAVKDIADVSSVLARLATLAGRSHLILDVGVEWADPPLSSPEKLTPSAHRAPGELWAARGWHGEDVVSYWTLRAVQPASVQFLDSRGQQRRWDREQWEEDCGEGTAWPVGRPDVHAPKSLLEAIRRCPVDLNLWLHPARRIEDRQIAIRPLHAKVLLLAYRRRSGREQTLAFIGSANASRQALLCAAPAGGNVECGIAFIVDGALQLTDLAPELVWAEPDFVQFAERTYAVPGPDVGRYVEGAVFEANASRLSVRWCVERCRDLRDWTLTYADRQVATGSGLPEAGTTQLVPFELMPATLEMIISTADGTASIPITIEDLTQLALGAAPREPSLRELLAVLGRRVSEERLALIHIADRGETSSRVLDQLFGEGFGAHDVFRAWWGLGDDLAQPTLSVAGFRLLVEGRLGARRVWDCVRRAAEKGREELSAAEAWFYGAELLRTLDAVELPNDETGKAKRVILDDLVAQLRADLAVLSPEGDASWLRNIADFYGLRDAEPTRTAQRMR